MDLSRPRLIDIYAHIGHAIQRRILSDTDTNGHDIDTNGHISSTDACAGHTEDHDMEEAFQHIYFVMIFMACLWFVGKVFARCGLPSLVGEIVCGIILGPNLLNFVPYSDALVVIGEIGLVLLVLEAGIDVSIGHLKVVGFRGCAVAVFGSTLPLGMGTGLATLYGEKLQSAFAIGACLAPTSMGIALNVLRNAKVLNTPTGQLIIAAAVLDDVIALMLLSELEAMANPSIASILLPLIVSPAFIIFFGFLAIKCTPWLIQKIMIKTSKHQHENVILLLLFSATFVLIPACFYAGSSHLLGAFLAGLMFCTDHTIHEAWSNQIKRIMQWMLRIFFACTIGFAVPIQDFWSKPVIIGGLLYFVAIIGKILTGIFAKPLCFSEFFTIAFSMSAWGEFAFILATASYGTGALDKDSYSSVLMAVLLSVVIAPLCLRMTLSMVRKAKEKKLSGARDAHYGGIGDKDEDLNVHPIYFCIHVKGKGRWGHQDKLLHTIFNLALEIIDFRAFNEAEYNYSHHMPVVQDVFYVLDKKLALPPTKRLGKVDERKLQQRYKEIKRSLKETMADPHSSIDVMRWLPGVRKTDDIQSPQKNGTKAKPKKRKTVNYCRKEAYKQARLALDQVDTARSSSYLVSGISRIRPSHDALHRDKFSYHGGIHTEEDDLIAMAFIDTLQSLQASLSPENRASPTGSNGNREPLSHDELFAKINTLRNCVERLQVFAPALSDDGNGNMVLTNPPSIRSLNGDNTLRSFDAHYKQTFTPLQQRNISAGSDVGNEGIENGHNRGVSEHGRIDQITHHKPALKSMAIPQPGLFTSHSHGLLPSHSHSHFNHLPRDIFPKDSYAGLHHSHSHGGHSQMVHSATVSEKHLSSTEETHSSENSDDFHCDTMYGDEDEHHRPLTNLYTNLDDLDEEPLEYNLNESSLNNTQKKVKRSTTWSKINIFKHKKEKTHSDDDSKAKKTKRKRKKKFGKKKDKTETNNMSELKELSLSSDVRRKISWDGTDTKSDEEALIVDPKMIEIPQSIVNKTHKKVFENKKDFQIQIDDIECIDEMLPLKEANEPNEDD